MSGRARAVVGALASAVLLVATAACSDRSAGEGASTTPPPAAAASSAAAAPSTAAATPAQVPLEVPAAAGHVHSMGKDPESGALLLATHTGLFRSTGGPFARVGPAIDLMGFVVAGPAHYLASGHPQPGVDLPQPVGLIETRDGGQTWIALSRGGRSDFHALTVAGEGVVGFDGALRRSDDRREWDDVDAAFEPLAMAGAAGDRRVVATTMSSVMVSEDAGRTWTDVPGSPAPALVSRADDAVIALDASGVIHRADPTGRSWRQERLAAPGASLLLATGTTADLEIVVLTEEGLMVSRAGAPFERLRASR